MDQQLLLLATLLTILRVLFFYGKDVPILMYLAPVGGPTQTTCYVLTMNSMISTREYLEFESKRLGLELLYNSPAVVPGSANPPPSLHYPGVRCFYVSICLGEARFHGFGPSPSVAVASAESQAYKYLQEVTMDYFQERRFFDRRSTGQDHRYYMPRQFPMHSRPFDGRLYWENTKYYEQDRYDTEYYRENRDYCPLSYAENQFAVPYPSRRHYSDQLPRSLSASAEETLPYVVPQSKEEVMNSLIDSSLNDPRDEQPEQMYYQQQSQHSSNNMSEFFEKQLEVKLVEIASQKGLLPSLEISRYSSRNFHVKANAGSYFAEYVHRKKKTAKQLAIKQLLKVLESLPDNPSPHDSSYYSANVSSLSSPADKAPPTLACNSIELLNEFIMENDLSFPVYSVSCCDTSPVKYFMCSVQVGIYSGIGKYFILLNLLITMNRCRQI